MACCESCECRVDAAALPRLLLDVGTDRPEAVIESPRRGERSLYDVALYDAKRRLG